MNREQLQRAEQAMREAEALQRLAMTKERWDSVVTLQGHIIGLADLLGREPLAQPR